VLALDPPARFCFGAAAVSRPDLGWHWPSRLVVTVAADCLSKGRVTMQLSKAFALAFTVVSVLFAVLLSLSTETLNARDADFASRAFAAAHTAKRKCINTCRARYRDCLSLKQIPSSECRGIYQDCTRYACNAGADGRPSWPVFPGEP
jgi:hypothetical protein